MLLLFSLIVRLIIPLRSDSFFTRYNNKLIPGVKRDREREREAAFREIKYTAENTKMIMECAVVADKGTRDMRRGIPI